MQRALQGMVNRMHCLPPIAAVWNSRRGGPLLRTMLLPCLLLRQRYKVVLGMVPSCRPKLQLGAGRHGHRPCRSCDGVCGSSVGCCAARYWCLCAKATDWQWVRQHALWRRGRKWRLPGVWLIRDTVFATQPNPTFTTCQPLASARVALPACCACRHPCWRC